MVVKLKPLTILYCVQNQTAIREDARHWRRREVRSPASVKDQHFLRAQRLPHTTRSIWSPPIIVIVRYHAQLRRIFGHYRVR